MILSVGNPYTTPGGIAYDVSDTGGSGRWYIAIRGANGRYRVISAAANRDLNPDGPTAQMVLAAVARKRKSAR